MVSRIGTQRQTCRVAMPHWVVALGPPQFCETSNEMRRVQPSPVQVAPLKAAFCQRYSGQAQEPLGSPVPSDPLTPELDP